MSAQRDAFVTECLRTAEVRIPQDPAHVAIVIAAVPEILSDYLVGYMWANDDGEATVHMSAPWVQAICQHVPDQDILDAGILL